jgi:hypothetical protein
MTMRQVEPLETRRLLAAFTASSVPELIADINAANAAGGSNTITLTPGTTFTLNAVNNYYYDGPAGLPMIADLDNLTILGNAATIQRSTTRGTPPFRLFSVGYFASLTLNNLTLSGGLVSNFEGSVGVGGAIDSDGTLELNGVTVQNCIVQGGFRGNGDAAYGGGIFSGGVLTIANSTIRNNQALGGEGGGSFFGAFFYPGGPAKGGGLFADGPTTTVTNTTFSSNLAQGGSGSGGAKGQKGGAGGDGLGGAIYASFGTVTLRQTTITQNTVQGGKGGNNQGSQKAPDGVGRGGGLYINAGVLVGLDSFTQAHTTSNTASTSDNDIFGSFSIL